MSDLIDDDNEMEDEHDTEQLENSHATSQNNIKRSRRGRPPKGFYNDIENFDQFEENVTENFDQIEENVTENFDQIEDIEEYVTERIDQIEGIEDMCFVNIKVENDAEIETEDPLDS